jgi:glycosyltransferase involved in cell wall biosynthesis
VVDGKKITVVIPCRNEEKIIAQTVKNVPDYVDEIIVVDNGSTDNTVEVAKAAGARVFTDKRALNGIGYGYAHMKGLYYATGDIIFAMDGDDTYPSYQIRGIVDYMEFNKLDFVTCCRLPLKHIKAISKTRRLGINILNLEVFLLYGVSLRDILTGMWVMRKEIIPMLDLQMGDWNLSPEVKISAFANPRIRFDEYHIDHFERGKEPSKQAIWKTGTSHFFYILKRRFTQDKKYRMRKDFRITLKPRFKP